MNSCIMTLLGAMSEISTAQLSSHAVLEDYFGLEAVTSTSWLMTVYDEKQLAPATGSARRPLCSY